VKLTWRLMLALLFVGASSRTAVAQRPFQLWGNVTFDWLKGDRLTYSFDLEPKALVVVPVGSPEWRNLDLTPSVEYAATTAFWETHSKKSVGIAIGDRVKLVDVNVGQILTLEGGLGRSFLQGAASVGVAYYAQWKLTDDHFATVIDLPLESPIGKHRVYGVGPDLTLPIAVKKRLVSLVNIRYFWETGARVKTQGQSLLITAMFPVPSPKIQ